MTLLLLSIRAEKCRIFSLAVLLSAVICVSATEHRSAFRQETDSLRQLIELSRRNGDIPSEGNARLGLYIAYANNGYESDYRDYDDDMQFYLRHRLDEPYYYAFSIHIDAMSKDGNKEEALREAQKELEAATAKRSRKGLGRIAYTLGNLCRQMNRKQESLHYYLEAIEALKDNPTDNILWMSYVSFCNSAPQQNRAAEAKARLLEWDALMRAKYAHVDADRPDARKWRYLYASVAAGVFTQLEEFAVAESYIAQAAALSNPHDPTDETIIQTLWVNYHEKRGNYAKALELIEKGIPPELLARNPEARLSLLKEKAEVAVKGAMYERAARWWEEAYLLRDSLQQLHLTEQLDALRTAHDVEKLTFEKERQTVYLEAAAVVCLLLMAMLAGWMYYSSRIKLKNKVLVRQLAAVTASTAPTPADSSEGRSAERSVETISQRDDGIEQLTQLLADKTLLARPDLNRQTLAHLLHTNETYLRERIRNHYGLSVSEFITGIRMKYACELLLTGMKLPDILEYAGLGSVSTFYRLFSKYFGTTPESYYKEQNRGRS
jgi:AraC-like DNA-binding protein